MLLRREFSHELNDTSRPFRWYGKSGIAEELRFDFFARQGEVGPAARVILALLEETAVAQAKIRAEIEFLALHTVIAME